MRQSDIYEMIEQQVMNQLENGIVPWRMCYRMNAYSCVSHQTQKAYSLLNQMILSLPGEYWSFEQVRKCRLKLRKGCHAKKIIFYKKININDGIEEDLNEFNPTIPIIKYYNVFHEDDIEGLDRTPNNITQEERERLNAVNLIEPENLIKNYLEQHSDLMIENTTSIPRYNRMNDCIYIPEKCRFTSIEEYYSTIFHEMIHSTKKYLERNCSREREELVAEIGAAYLCGRTGITMDKLIPNMSAYCAGWIKKIKIGGGIRDFIWASSRAEKAAKLILGEKEEEVVEQ